MINSTMDRFQGLFDHEEGSSSEDDENPSSVSEANEVDLARDDSPKALVRRENSAIRCVKLFAILVLLCAAGTIAGLIFQFTRGSEQASFRNDFVLISESITRSLLQDTEAYFTSAQSVATSLTILMEAYNTTQIDFSVPLPRYRSLTAEIVASSYFATWSPLLRSEEERIQFEAAVASKEQEGFFDTLSHPPCFVCGDENMTPSTPNAVVVFPGTGQYQCDDLDFAARNGLIDESACSFVTDVVLEKCSCAPSTAKGNTREKRSPSEGICRFQNEKNLTIVDEQRNGGPYLPMFIDSLLVLDRQPLLYNHLSHPRLAEAASQMIFTGIPQMTSMLGNEEPTFYSKALGVLDSGPASILYFPVESAEGADIAGALSLYFNWANFLRNPVPRNGKLSTVVIESSCGQVHTYKIKDEGVNLEWIGDGDFHDRRYDHMVGQTSYQDFSYFRLAAVGRDLNTTQEGSCDYRFSGK
jgi:hypothetical protein